MDEKKVSLVMPMDLYLTTQKIAKEENRTVSAMLRNALEQYISAYYMQKNLRNGDMQKVLEEIKAAVLKTQHTDITK